jgi:membrane protein YdbS with pleckstrin-like domain
LVGAEWLYTYRVTALVQYIEYFGSYRHHYHPSQRVTQQPWWGVSATVALLVIGAAITVGLLPQWRRPIRRFTNSLANPSS